MKTSRYCFLTLALLSFSLTIPLVGFGAEPGREPLRSIHDVYADSKTSSRMLSRDGISRSSDDDMAPQLLPALSWQAEIKEALTKEGNTFLVEVAKVQPYGAGGVPSKLAILNALYKVEDLQGITYYSSKKKRDVPLFEDAYLVAEPNSRSPVPGRRVWTLPESETLYLRLKDANFGSSLYRGTVDFSYPEGVIVKLTNIKPLSVALIPVVPGEKISTLLYLLPLKEGLLIYGAVTGEVASVIADNINMSSAMRKRLAVFIQWLSSGLQ